MITTNQDGSTLVESIVAAVVMVILTLTALQGLILAGNLVERTNDLKQQGEWLELSAQSGGIASSYEEKDLVFYIDGTKVAALRVTEVIYSADSGSEGFTIVTRKKGATGGTQDAEKTDSKDP